MKKLSLCLALALAVSYIVNYVLELPAFSPTWFLVIILPNFFGTLLIMTLLED